MLSACVFTFQEFFEKWSKRMRQIVTFGCLFLIVNIFSPAIFAQGLKYPNELKGFQFYGRGKLKNFELKVSNGRQALNEFGQDCDWRWCDYDENWEVMFIFAEEFWREVRFEENIMYTVAPKPQFLSTLWCIYLRSKKPISFASNSFPREFKRVSGVAEHGVSTLTYYDGNGLSYTLNADDYNDGKYKGILREIGYGLPEKGWRDSFFVTQVENITDPNP